MAITSYSTSVITDRGHGNYVIMSYGRSLLFLVLCCHIPLLRSFVIVLNRSGFTFRDIDTVPFQASICLCR